MTVAENNKYYQTVLIKMGFTAEQIHVLLTQYPIGKAVVKEQDRKEGTLLESLCHCKGEKILLLYRTEGAWVGLSSFNKIKSIEGKYLTRRGCYYKYCNLLNIDECKNFIVQHFPDLDAASNIIKANASNGEKLIAAALQKMGFDKAFKIVSEYQIPALIGFQNLWMRSPRYDFAILDQNSEKPLLYIEFDGPQHYTGGQKKSLLLFQRDAAKNAYAFYTLTPLIRFPNGVLFEDNNIEVVMNIIKIYLSAGKFTPTDNENN